MLGNENLKKLFYYCLKRTGNRESAEDLAGDISLEILTMLNRGYKPKNFNAWLWTVARAKYAVWVKDKKIFFENIVNEDISDNPAATSHENIESEIIKNEERVLLRRELSIMSKEYREITVAYYIENRKISDISKAVNLPEGTIKRKLSESRKYLKEGINMTRTYGKRSYSPDNVEFTVHTKNTIDKVPYSLIESKLAKNILLEAYTNPCSTEELSVSLGVASPYLEEELDKLTEGLLIVKTRNGKYETDFIILDIETQKKIFDKTLETADKICEKLMFFAGSSSNFPIIIEKADLFYINEYQSTLAKKYVGKFTDEHIEIKLDDGQKQKLREQFRKVVEKWKDDFGNYSTGGAISADLSMWFHLFKTIRDISLSTEKFRDIAFQYSKSYKGEWSITGFESYPEHEIKKYRHGTDWKFENNTHLFKYEFKSLGISPVKPSLNDINLFADILRNNKKFDDLSDNEKERIKELEEKQLAVVENNFVSPAFPVLFTGGIDKLNDYFLEAEFSEELKSVMNFSLFKSGNFEKEIHEEISNLFEYNLAQIRAGLPERFNERAKFCARDMLTYLNNAVLKYAFERQYLPMTDKPVGIGAYIIN